MNLRSALNTLQKKDKRYLIPLETVWADSIDRTLPLGEYPRPQLKRRDWQSLHGTWRDAITQDATQPQKWDGSILVPFSPESRLSGVERTLMPGQYLWYEREITLPALSAEKRLLLHFDGVDERCAVWWNGHLLGHHRNGYLAFVFDVTDYLRPGRNRLRLAVRDDTDTKDHCIGKQKLSPGGMYYSPQSGIWQNVWLETVPRDYIKELKLTPDLDAGTLKLEIEATCPLPVTVLLQGKERHFPAGHFQPAGKAACAKLRLAIEEMTGQAPHPWSPEDPWLYDLTITAGEDKIESYFALRKFSVGKNRQGFPCLLLNNQPYFMHGVLDQGYWPESLMTPPSEEAMIFDIQSMKRLGFNMIRKHIKIESRRWYYHCDRLGMIVWQDMINGGRIHPLWDTYLPTLFPALWRLPDRFPALSGRTGHQNRSQWEKDLLAMIQELFNHPSIALWTIFNEGWGQFDAARILQLVKAADPTRLVDHASGWFDQGLGDVCSEHNYFRKLRIRKDERPFVLSEYGGQALALPGHISTNHSYGYSTCPDQESYRQQLSALFSQIRQLSHQGLAAAVYTQVSDIEDEINGLYTYDRKLCKADPPIIPAGSAAAPPENQR